MKNKYTICFLLVVLFMCCACSSTNKEATSINKSKVNKDIWGFHKTYETLDSNLMSMTNGFNTKEGYYFIKKFENADRSLIGTALVKYDEEKNQFNIVNDNKTKNCNFNNPQNCSSFSDTSSPSYNYYNDKIYTESSSYDMNTDMTTYEIYEMDMNGNNRTLVFSKVIEANTTTFVPYFTNGYMFFTNGGEIGIVDLETWEWSTIVNQKNANFYGLQVFDKEIYVEARNYKDENKLYPLVFLRVDYQNKKLIPVLECEGNVLFYQKQFTIQMIDEKTYYINTRTGDKIKLSDSWGYVFYDHENDIYLYSDLFANETESKKYILFKSDGTILDTYVREDVDGLGEIFEKNSFIFAKNIYADDGSILNCEFYKTEIVDGKFTTPYQLGSFGN